MPNLLKKKKGNSRISRLFSDLQTPPKRGGSLVVETGFPTSIIDLFVKNRDRLKKKKQPPTTITTTTIEEKEEEVEVEVCLDSDLELEVKKNENKCVELDDKCYKVEGNDVNERLGRGSLGNKVICLSGLMGLCVLYSKWFVASLSIGALFLYLFEFVGKLNLLKCRWVFDGVISRGYGGCSRVGFEHGVELEIVNDLDGCGLDVSDCDVKCEIEEVIELNDGCGMRKNSNFDSVGECGNVSSKRVIEGECCKMVDENGKTKKGKKFWKRCMFKHISKKRKHSKQGKETHEQICERELLALTTCIVSNDGELEKERKLEDTNESSLSSSLDKVVEQRREELINLEKHSSCIRKRLPKQNLRTKSCRMVVYRGLNVECLAVMAIALVGLIGSRMLGLVLTLSCCVGLKLIRGL